MGIVLNLSLLGINGEPLPHTFLQPSSHPLPPLFFTGLFLYRHFFKELVCYLPLFSSLFFESNPPLPVPCPEFRERKCSFSGDFNGEPSLCFPTGRFPPPPMTDHSATPWFLRNRSDPPSLILIPMIPQNPPPLPLPFPLPSLRDFGHCHLTENPQFESPALLSRSTCHLPKKLLASKPFLPPFSHSLAIYPPLFPPFASEDLKTRILTPGISLLWMLSIPSSSRL